ncbi:MAG TPA: YWFCY domain-containing protein [Puia sp.]|nr:YWFCY domain-containing protein [Puia sp.]
MEQVPKAKNVSWMFLLGGIVLLLLHVYYFTYGWWAGLRLTSRVTDALLVSISRTGLFRGPFLSLLLAGLFLMGANAGGATSTPGQGSLKGALLRLSLGGLLYFCSPWALQWSTGSVVGFAGYLLMLVTGLLLTLWSETRLIGMWLGRQELLSRFGESETGFPQESRKVATEFGLSLRARYRYKGRWLPSWINVINARRGILILGNPGSGKSRYLIEPMLEQLMEKGLAVFVYDYKFPALTDRAWQLFQFYRDRYPALAKFQVIHFDRSRPGARCNLLDPRLLEGLSDAIDASRTILLSLNKTWVHRQGEFFIESPINFVSALIWYLRGVDGGRYCTLPHVIELAQVPLHRLLPLLAGEAEIASLVQPFVDAFDNKAMEMLSGQIASATIALARLASPDIYWVLTGNDVSLDINDPAAPAILCLGGDPVRQEALAPVISLYIDRLNRRVNQAGRHPCAIVCDEFGTVRAYSMASTMATGRSNNIIPVLAVQDISQLRLNYTRDEADLLLNVAGNVFCGQVGGETARWMSERFPRVLQGRNSVSRNSRDTTVNESAHWEDSIRPATIANLSAGEFVGVVADDPGMEMRWKAFWARVEIVKRVGADGACEVGRSPALDVHEAGPAPGIRLGWYTGREKVGHGEVDKNFFRVKEEVRKVVMGKSQSDRP